MHRCVRLIPLPLAAWAAPPVGLPALLLLLLSLGACTPDYPMDKPGTWSLPPGHLGSNDANLRVMLVDPNDLTAGASADGSEGVEAAPPVQRVVSGRRPALQDTNATPLGSSGEQTSGSSGQAGTNGVVQ
jgi:hypothetical protein